MVEIDGQALPFCNEECEGLYRSYWLPKYGKRANEASTDAANG
jgi:ribosomal protein L24E